MSEQQHPGEAGTETTPRTGTSAQNPLSGYLMRDVVMPPKMARLEPELDCEPVYGYIMPEDSGPVLEWEPDGEVRVCAQPPTGGDVRIVEIDRRDRTTDPVVRAALEAKTGQGPNPLGDPS